MFKMLNRYLIRSFETGLLFKDGDLVRVLDAGRHWIFDPFRRHELRVLSRREPWLIEEELDAIIKSGLLQDRIDFIDLKDHQRALVWIDGRFDRFLTPGLYAWWNDLKEVRVELVDARNPRFDHRELILQDYWPKANAVLDICTVERNHAGVLFIDGRYLETLTPGRYAFWKGEATAKVVELDLREQLFDVAGQDIMTADKVSLRLNAVVTYSVVDAHRAVTSSESASQALYREVQLALRAVIGSRELDTFLSDKEEIVQELSDMVRSRAETLGLKVDSLGIRDVILPGDMKDLMNRVTEAKKAAEANLISRREETAAMRSQANTAKLLDNNPALMRMKELEVLEKIAASGQLNVILGEQGLSDRIMKLL